MTALAYAALAPGLLEAPFVSVCALRNLAVIRQLYGAAVGSRAAEVLRDVATAVAAECEPGALVAESGGPDLVVLHTASSCEQASRLARRLRDALDAVALPAGAGVVHLQPMVATVELGGGWPGSADELLRTLEELRSLAERSDERLALVEQHEATRALERLRSRDARLATVTEALAHGRVEVHFQPVVNLHSGVLEDVEALARIRTPAGLLTASEFIDDLHRLGETAALDSLVMRSVGENAHALARATGRLFLNVSPLSLASSAFREQLAATMARLRAEGLGLVLVLELTEQALLEHHHVIREIHRAHGVSFAVDDFGTGYSSLRTVSELAVSRVISILKVDGSLTRGIADSPESYKVVLAIAHLARSLELRVVAEQVETPRALELLRTTGIECGQGYLFDPPLAPEELLARHAEGPRPGTPPAARPQLRLLEPYLHRAFEAFYDTLLADPHFARFFRDEAQVKSLVERQELTLLASLDEDDDALRARYTQLGRMHSQLGIPLATFLKGADVLHEQLLDVLLHATREASVLRDTGRFFGALRGFMARGYVEQVLPGARAELEALRGWAARALALPPEVRGSLFGCMEGVFDALELSLRADAAGVARVLPPSAAACPAGPWLRGAGQDEPHRRVHDDVLNLDYFVGRQDYVAAFPLLEGLLGRFQRLLISLAGRERNDPA